MIARPMKVRDRKSCNAANIASDSRHGTSIRSGRSTTPRWMLGADIGGLDEAVIDAEDQDQRHLGDEQQAEEEGEAAQPFLAAPLERAVIDLIDQRAQRIKGRQRDDAGEDRIDAEPRIGDIGDVGAENDEGRMGDVDDVEHAEGNRDADRDGGIEAAEQQSGRHGVEQQVVGEHVRCPPLFENARLCP